MRQYEYDEHRQLSKTELAGGCIVTACLFVCAVALVIGPNGVVYMLQGLFN